MIKISCSKCCREIETKFGDGKIMIFPHLKGKLCKKCYEYYEGDIKKIEYKYGVLRGYDGAEQ